MKNFKPTKYIDPWQFYKDEDELKDDIKKMKELLNERETLIKGSTISKEFLEKLLVIDEKYMLLSSNLQMFLWAVQWSNFKDPLPGKYHPIYSELDLRESELNDEINQMMHSISMEDYKKIIESSDELKSVDYWALRLKQLAWDPISEETKKKVQELRKQESDLYNEYTKLDNLAPVDKMEFKGETLNVNELEKLLSDPIKTNSEDRKKIFRFIKLARGPEPDRKNEIVFEMLIIKKKIEELLGTKNLVSKLEIQRHEKPGFISKLIENANIISNKLWPTWKEIKYKKIKEFNNLEKVEQSDLHLPYYEDVKLPYELVFDFYRNDAGKYLGEHVNIIVDNYSEKGRLAIIEHEDKVNWGAAAPFSTKKNVYTMLFNYSENLSHSPYVLAHEMGHSMHGYYAAKSTRAIYFGWPPIIGEGVSDTFGNLLGLTYLQKDVKESKKIVGSIVDRFFSVINNFSKTGGNNLAVYNALMNGEIKTLKDIQELRYKNAVEMNKGKPKMFEELDLTRLGANNITPALKDFTAINYLASALIGINLAAHAIDGNIEPLLKVMKQGASNDSVTILKNAGLDIESKEFYDKASSLIEKLMNYMNK